MNKTLLHTANGTTIALELKGYGISVVYEEPNFPGKWPPRDFQAFIDSYDIDSDTPILQSPVTVRLGAFHFPLTHNETFWLHRTGWLFSSGADIAPEQMPGLVQTRLMAGKPVTLIPQTARAVPLESIDIWAHGLTKLERAVLKCIVQRQRGPRAKPIVLAIAVADGKRVVSKWRPAVWWSDASRWFPSTSRQVRRLMPRRAAEPAEK